MPVDVARAGRTLHHIAPPPRLLCGAMLRRCVVPAAQHTSLTVRSMQAINPAGVGPWSSVAKHVTRPAMPGPPGDVRVVAMTSTSLTIAWDPAAEHGRAVDRYVVEYMPQGGAGWMLAMADLQVSCTVPGLTPGRFYSFRVRAENAVRASWGSGHGRPLPATAACVRVHGVGNGAPGCLEYFVST